MAMGANPTIVTFPLSCVQAILRRGRNRAAPSTDCDWPQPPISSFAAARLLLIRPGSASCSFLRDHSFLARSRASATFAQILTFAGCNSADTRPTLGTSLSLGELPLSKLADAVRASPCSQHRRAGGTFTGIGGNRDERSKPDDERFSDPCMVKRGLDGVARYSGTTTPLLCASTTADRRLPGPSSFCGRCRTICSKRMCKSPARSARCQFPPFRPFSVSSNPRR